jgi:hypothetical protein
VYNINVDSTELEILVGYSLDRAYSLKSLSKHYQLSQQLGMRSPPCPYVISSPGGRELQLARPGLGQSSALIPKSMVTCTFTIPRPDVGPRYLCEYLSNLISPSQVCIIIG